MATVGDSPGRNEIAGDLVLAGLLTPVHDAPDDRPRVTGRLDGRGGTIALDVGFAGGGAVEGPGEPGGARWQTRSTLERTGALRDRVDGAETHVSWEAEFGPLHPDAPDAGEMAGGREQQPR